MCLRPAWGKASEFIFEKQPPKRIKNDKKVAWWHPPIIPAPGKWRLRDQNFKARLSYIVSQRPAWAT